MCFSLQSSLLRLSTEETTSMTAEGTLTAVLNAETARATSIEDVLTSLTAIDKQRKTCLVAAVI